MINNAVLTMDLRLNTIDTQVNLHEVQALCNNLERTVSNISHSINDSFALMRDSLDELSESIPPFTAALNNATEALCILMESFSEEETEWMAGLSAGADAAGLLLTLLTASADDVGSILGAIANACGMTGGTLMLVIVGVLARLALLIAAIALVVANWDAISAALQQVFLEMQNAVAGITEWFSSSVIPCVTSFFANLWEVISYYGPLFWEEIVNFATGIWNELVSIFHGAAQWVGDNVITPVMDLFAPIVDWFAALFGSIWQTIDDVFYNIGVIVTGCWDTIHAVWNAVAAWFNNTVIQPIYNFFANLWTGVVGLVTTAWTEIMTFLGNIATWMDAHVIQPLVTLFAGVWENFAAFAADAWAAVCNVFGAVAAFFENVFADAWAGIVAVFDIAGDIFVNIGDAVLSAFRVIANGIIGGLNNVLAVPFNGINGAITIIRNMEILDLRPFSRLRNITVPQIPYLAKGAVLPANKPFLAMVGDQKHGTNIEAPLATIQDAVALVMNDQAAAMMAGFEAVVRAINEKNATLELDGREIWAAYNAYNRKAAVVRGGSV